MKVDPAEIRREMRSNLPPDAQPQRVMEELQSQRILRAVESDRQLNEVMVDFWMNHFNIFAGKGKVHGKWPGLSSQQLYENRDLAIITDFRDVFGELLTKQLAVASLKLVFPGYESSPGKWRGILV